MFPRAAPAGQTDGRHEGTHLVVTFSLSEPILCPGAGTDPCTVLLLLTLTGDPAQSGPQTASTGDVVHMAYRRPGTVVEWVAGHGFEVLHSEVIDSPPEASQVTQDVVVLARRRP